MSIRDCDEFGRGFGWVVDEFLERCSHALVVDGRVWLIDALDREGLDERVHAAGEPAGVIQLLDRHNRDCAALALRFGTPYHFVPRARIGPFEFVPIKTGRFWQEVALWWPDQRVLVVGDALGTSAYFRAGEERLAVHPALRLLPPREQLAGIDPATVLCGHGTGVFDEAGAALREALSTSRRRMLRQVGNAVRAWRASRPS